MLKDSDCAINTSLLYGYSKEPIYGKGIPIKPNIPGKQKSTYDTNIHLSKLLPLEDYDFIIVLLSGGKDSIASYYHLLELGVPKEKMEFWHHDIDGGNSEKRMDWPVTQAYVRAFAEAEGVKLRVLSRANGFFGEVYRVGASFPIKYEDNGEIKTCKLTRRQIESDRLRKEILEGQFPVVGELAKLREYGYRLKFPMKTSDLKRRWCSAILKIDVASAVIRQLTKLDKTRESTKILVVSGERRGESAGRSKYNEMEVHRTNATARAHRLVHQWRPVIDYTLKDVWEVLKRHHVNPHPCYRAGWNRCSCMMCIFSLPAHWAGIRELFPASYEMFRQVEIDLGFTLDNKLTLDEYVGDTKSCVCNDDQGAIEQLQSGEFTVNDVYMMHWVYPAGAFKGSEGGPC